MSIREEFEKAFKEWHLKQQKPIQFDSDIALWAAKWMAERMLKKAEDTLLPHECGACADNIMRLRQLSTQLEEGK